MNTLDHLVYMTNQIARNFGTLTEQEAAHATADHMLKYWDPRMKNRIIGHAAEGDSALSDVAAQAVYILGQQTGQNASDAISTSA